MYDEDGNLWRNLNDKLSEKHRKAAAKSREMLDGLLVDHNKFIYEPVELQVEDDLVDMGTKQPYALWTKEVEYLKQVDNSLRDLTI